MQILQPPGWAKPKGYANGIAAKGTHVFVAGQVGWTADCQWQTDDFAQQFAQALRNVVAVCAAAGAKPEHIVRLTWFITSKPEYLAPLKPIGAPYHAITARHYPSIPLLELTP